MEVPVPITVDSKMIEYDGHNCSERLDQNELKNTLFDSAEEEPNIEKWKTMRWMVGLILTCQFR